MCVCVCVCIEIVCIVFTCQPGFTYSYTANTCRTMCGLCVASMWRILCATTTTVCVSHSLLSQSQTGSTWRTCSKKPATSSPGRWYEATTTHTKSLGCALADFTHYMFDQMIHTDRAKLLLFRLSILSRRHTKPKRREIVHP